MQIVNSSSCVTEVNSPVRDLLTGFERQNNSLSTLEGQGRDITEEKDLSEETSRDCMRTGDCRVQHQLLGQYHANQCFSEAGGRH